MCHPQPQPPRKRQAVAFTATITNNHQQHLFLCSRPSPAQLAVSCTELAALNLSACAGVTLAGVRDFKLLRVLDLSGSGVLCEALTGALESCHALEEVVLDHCQALDSLSLRMSGLKV